MPKRDSRFLEPPVLPFRFTIGMALFLLIEGVWGLFRPVVFGVLTTNLAHAVIHVVLAILGLVAAKKHYVKSYLGFVSSLLLVVAILWFIPGTRSVPAGLLNVNLAAAVLNFLLGAAGLTIAATSRPKGFRSQKRRAGL